MIRTLLMAGGSLPVVELHRSTGGAALNMRTLFSNPSAVALYRLYIDAGVVIGGAVGQAFSLRTGTGWPAGSALAIVNNGNIEGKGGDADATPGETALLLDGDCAIDNANGFIKGGGGGGGGGGFGGPVNINNLITGSAAGGGAGGGQGNPGGTRSQSTGGDVQGFDGTAGSRSAPGFGGGGGSISGPTGSVQGGDGADGGAWGNAGGGGTSSSDGHAGGSGTAGGKAVDLAGHTATWLGGNNPTQVVGVVS